MVIKNINNMGTRGKYGFYYNGKYYLFYNHFDSYVDGLGNKILKELIQLIKTCILENVNFYEYIKNYINNAKIVTDNDKPTPGDIIKLQYLTDLQVSEESMDNWYCLTRKGQGSITSHLYTGIFYCEVLGKLPEPDIFIEFTYIIDLEKHVFYEVNDSMNRVDLDELLKNSDCEISLYKEESEEELVHR